MVCYRTFHLLYFHTQKFAMLRLCSICNCYLFIMQKIWYQYVYVTYSSKFLLVHFYFTAHLRVKHYNDEGQWRFLGI